jgi:CDGSH-type Zn-finger protein
MEIGMPTNHEREPNAGQKIVVQANGPYTVQGGIPLVRKTQVVSEYGEPLTWKKEEEIETAETYILCRCGHSADKPFCDASHWEADFDGAETADTRTTAERRATYAGGTHIVVKCDESLCSASGFCGNRTTNVERMVPDTGNTQVRAQVMAMIERCPSGALAYSLEAGEADVEPDLPRQIAVVTEITADGPVAGPLWVTGYIPIERADGQPLEVRNRVLLCGCGLSKNKPLCDGAHRATGVKGDWPQVGPIR